MVDDLELSAIKGTLEGPMNNCLEMASSGGTTNKTLGVAGMASIKLSLRATRSPNDLSATRE
jgi:hypothetical protein